MHVLSTIQWNVKWNRGPDAKLFPGGGRRTLRRTPPQKHRVRRQACTIFVTAGVCCNRPGTTLRIPGGSRESRWRANFSASARPRGTSTLSIKGITRALAELPLINSPIRRAVTSSVTVLPMGRLRRRERWPNERPCSATHFFYCTQFGGDELKAERVFPVRLRSGKNVTGTWPGGVV